MKVRSHLSRDLLAKYWHLEAHEIKAGRWYLASEAPWRVQQEKLSILGIPRLELARSNSLEAAGAASAWTDAVEIDTGDLVEAWLTLHPTFASAPQQLTNF